jgi:hypothetical protein
MNSESGDVDEQRMWMWMNRESGDVDEQRMWMWMNSESGDVDEHHNMVKLQCMSIHIGA